MHYSQFHIGLDFWCGGKRWRCTDVGSRVIVAISLEPHEIVNLEVDPEDPSKRTERQYTTPNSLAVPDRPYTVALRALRDEPTPQRHKELNAVLRGFIPQWHVHGNYFPLADSGLTLEDIAYCNIVRCRTSYDNKPGKLLTSQCIDEHFVRWLDLLHPKVIVFVGKWAWRQGKSAVDTKGIPCAFMNRQFQG